MAIKKGQFLTGILGPVVLRTRNGKQVVSARVPKGKIKHTIETKKSSQTFGMSSKLAAEFRRTIEEQVSGMQDDDMFARLSGAFFSILSRTRNKTTREYHFEKDSFDLLNGFNFHQSFRVRNRMTNLPELNLTGNTLRVDFPQLHQPGFLQFPFNSYKCRVTLSLSLFRLKDGLMVADSATEQAVILKAVELEAPLSFDFSVPNGCLYVLCVYLQYAATGKYKFNGLNSPRLKAACICKAEISPGQYTAWDSYRWEEMTVY